MSSFVIDKKQYMKAAGYIAGVAKELKLWIYNFGANRNMIPEDYKKFFAACYKMNALSVAIQYNDPEPEKDINTYDDIFNEYMEYGKRDAITLDHLKENIIELHSFFNSALYQVETPEYFNKMSRFFHLIESQLLPHMLPGYKSDSWSEFKITKNERKIIALTDLIK